MNKKARYWAIGIVAVIAVLFAAWLVAAQNNRNNGDPDRAGADHAQMGHGAAGSAGNAGNVGLGNYLKDQEAIMAEMMRGMEGIEKSGNASIDFLAGMIPHHQSAVDMAESYLKHGGRDEKLVNIANDIIEAQTKEIGQMNDLIQELRQAGRKDEEKEAAYLEEYQKMFANHHMGHGSAGSPASVEAAFSEGMIEHHQMAVDMAKSILDYSDEEDVKGMARAMIDVQEMEIAQMRAILDDLGE